MRVEFRSRANGTTHMNDACLLNAVLGDVRDFIRTSPLLNIRRVHDSLTVLQLTVEVLEDQLVLEDQPSATILRHPACDFATFSEQTACLE